MADPILCPKCKRPVRAEAEFCNACGQRLKKRCVSTTCDAVLSSSDTHCHKCGTSQGGANALSGVLSRIDGEKAVKVGQGMGGCLLAPFKFIIQTFIGAGPIGWIALLLLPILLVFCGFINNLTKGLAGQILIVWPLQMLAGSVVGACLPVLFLFGLIGLTFIAVRKKWLQRVTVWAQAHGRENRVRRMEQQRQRAEENARQAAALPRPIVPPTPAFPPPPERYTRPAPVQGFDPVVVEAQVRRVMLRPGFDRDRAELLLRVAIPECGLDHSPAALKKAVDSVLLRQG